MKLGRNDTCPCGSGKKYKKCCMGKIDPNQSKNDKDAIIWWTRDMVEELPTEEIFRKLMKFGVLVNKEMFINEISESWSANDILKKWEKRYKLDIYSPIIDFIYLAIIVLSTRLVPDHLLIEHLDHMVETGYNAWEMEDNEQKAAMIWHDAWQEWKNWLKNHNIYSVKKLDGMRDKLNFFFSEWITDFETVSHNVGTDLPSFHEIRFNFVSDILNFFTDLNLSMKENLTRVQAEELFHQGRIEEANQILEDYARKHENCPWLFIGWGDLYNPKMGSLHPDKQKAKELYKEAIKRAVEENDREVATARFYRLEND